MRYIAKSNGYLQQVSFGADITCAGKNCTEYTGAVPSGYKSLAEWYCQEGEKLYRWKITSGQLTLDSSASPPDECAHGKKVVVLPTSTTTTEEELEAELSALFSAMAADEMVDVRFLCAILGAWSIHGTLFKSEATYGTLQVRASKFGHVTELRKCFYNGEWKPFEWVNPPMEIGVEYRTTEWFQDRPVYTKRVNFGALPNKTVSSVSYGVPAATCAIRCNGTWGGNSTLPYIYNTQRADIYANAARVYITTNFDMSSYDGTVNVWYVK